MTLAAKENKCCHSAVDVIEDGAVAHSNGSATVYFYFCPPVPACTTEPAGSHSSSESITPCRIGLQPIRSHDTESALFTPDSAVVCTSQSRCIDFCRKIWYPKLNQTFDNFTRTPFADCKQTNWVGLKSSSLNKLQEFLMSGLKGNIVPPKKRKASYWCRKCLLSMFHHVTGSFLELFL